MMKKNVLLSHSWTPKREEDFNTKVKVKIYRGKKFQSKLLHSHEYSTVISDYD